MAKEEAEEEALRVLLDYFKKAGRGQWEGNRGPDPPDFIIANQQAGELAAVEHTRFFWPPEEMTFDWALKSVKKEVNQKIGDRVQGVFGVSIDHENRQAFSKSFSELSKPKRREVSKWLADAIETLGTQIAVGGRRHLDGPLHCALIKYGESGPGEMGWVRSLSMGSDPGIKLMAAQIDGNWYSFAKRLDRPDTVLSELEAVLRRKAKSLKLVDYGRRILLIEYYATGHQTLRHIAEVLKVPPTLDDLFFVIWEESGPRIMQYRSVSKG